MTKRVFKFFTSGYLRALTIVLAICVVTSHIPLMADPTDDSQPPVAESNDMGTISDQSYGQTAASDQAATPMPPEQIDTLVAPIALYPDPLISQILVASTYPLELVQANQWLQQHPQLQGQALKDAATQENWDPSIQALVLFPDVMKRLNADISWTTHLGNAFLANQGSVMDGIQRMRTKAEQAGKLKSTPQENVTTTTQSGQRVVEIQPADPDVIYVPVYNPVWIWGPPDYYYYPAWYYPPPPPFGVWFFWGPAFHMSYCFPGWIGFGGWGGWGWRVGWRDRVVVVNHNFFVNNHYSAVRYATIHNRTVWVHNPVHRTGVAYPNRALSQRFNAPHEVGHPVFAHPTVNQVQQQFHQRAMTGPGTQRMGNRTIAPDTFNRNRSAFGGTTHGSTTRAYSNRGRTSLGHVNKGKTGTSLHGLGTGNRSGNVDGGGRR